MQPLSDKAIMDMAHARRHEMVRQITLGDNASSDSASTAFYLRALTEAALLGVDLVIQAMADEVADGGHLTGGS
jgi:hypothetical protein